MIIRLDDILNVRNSTRSLSDEVFEESLPHLAEELELVDFRQKYSERELMLDWEKLKNWECKESKINSTSRIGMKLCEHFFPNFYDIKNPRGESFQNLWKAKNLEKILRWNRKSHSTPYLSELRRGIYFCCGLTKNTMYRPQMMKMACLNYDPKIVLDPCAGWGGRMLGAVSSGCKYIGFEPNTRTYKNLMTMVEFLGIGDMITLIQDDCRNMNNYDLPTVGMVLTSPPYFDLEIYADEETQSVRGHDSYESWSTGFLREIIRLSLSRLEEDGVSCWNVGKVRNRDMNEDVLKYHEEFGFCSHDVLKIYSSKRQSNQSSKKNEKSHDNTVVYKGCSK
jgi:tRNA1(Val) A37 N6-methylase TrmN6